MDDCNTTGQLANPLLHLFLVKVRSRKCNLVLDFLNPFCNGFLFASTTNQNGVFLVDDCLTNTTQHINGSILQFHIQILGDDSTASQDGNILQHFLSSVAKARSLHCCTLECTTQVVQDNGGQCFAFDIFCNNQQLLAHLYNLFQQRQDFLNVADGSVCQEDQSVIVYDLHLLPIGYHIWRQIATVKLHTFYHFAVGLCGLAFFNRDDTICCHLFHCLCNQLADIFIRRRNGCNSCNILRTVDFLGIFLNAVHCGIDCLCNPLAKYHRVCTCCNVLQSFVNDCLCQNGCSCRTVTSCIIGLGCHFSYQLCTHILKGIFQFDILCNGHTVIRYQRCTKFLIQYHISALRTEGNLYGVCQLINTSHNCISCICIVFNFFCHDSALLFSIAFFHVLILQQQR